MSKLISVVTQKIPEEVIEDVRKNAAEFNLIIRAVFDMAGEFRNYGVAVDKDFEYYSIMLCNPEKAYRSILKRPGQGALLFPSKQEVVFKEKGNAVISYAAVEESDVKELFFEDEEFQKDLSVSSNNIISLIKAVM